MAAPNRETVLTYGELYGNTAFDTFGRDVTPAYDVFMADANNNPPTADLRSRAGQNAPATLFTPAALSVFHGHSPPRR